MNEAQRSRATNCVLGALVADAASMGLHWVYSQRRLQELAPEAPEFHEPNAADYAGNVGYFAHGMKQAGEFSHYGEQAWVMLRSLAQTGLYDQADYTDRFRSHFGYGGAFVGYIDRPTRDTLDNLYGAERQSLDRVQQIPTTLAAQERSGLMVKLLAAAKRRRGEALREEAVAIAGTLADPEAARAWALAVVEALQQTPEYPGANDEQLPAVSKLPALAAVHATDPDYMALCENAIRVTNNAPRALDFGRVCARLLQSLLLEGDRERAIAQALAAASQPARELLEKALAMDAEVAAVTRQFGMHCDLGAGIPSVLANLRTATSFREAIRRNILAGGDNCGRAIPLGAACGALFGRGGESGIPEDWIVRLPRYAEILADIDRLGAF